MVSRRLRTLSIQGGTYPLWLSEFRFVDGKQFACEEGFDKQLSLVHPPTGRWEHWAEVPRPGTEHWGKTQESIGGCSCWNQLAHSHALPSTQISPHSRSPSCLHLLTFPAWCEAPILPPIFVRAVVSWSNCFTVSDTFQNILLDDVKIDFRLFKISLAHTFLLSLSPFSHKTMVMAITRAEHSARILVL